MTDKIPCARFYKRGFFISDISMPGESVSSLPERVRRKVASSLAPFFLAILLHGCADPVFAQTQPPMYQVIMAEAVSEGYSGMYAVACVIRNRGGDLHGFCGAKRKDLSLFCNRQGGKALSEARQIERIVFGENGPDSTGGATHFEAVERYGMPYWAKGMQVTTKIGQHTFFKRRSDGTRGR